ncbi:hypothetical protein ACJ41O_001361 [Fusarium nematophilum]
MVRFITDPKGVKDPSSEEVPLEVIAAGLPRAATSSMQAALERIGVAPAMHMAEILPHPSLERLIIQALNEPNAEARHKILRKLLHGHRAICDLPVVYFTTDFMDMYPNAKVVLNGRPNPEVWAKSAYDSLHFFFTLQFRLIGLLWTTDRLWYEMTQHVPRWSKENLGTDNVWTVEAYNKYYDFVRAEAKKRGREVLDFKAEDGWEPLCKFLGKDVPDEPFPRLNEKKTFRIIKAIIITKGLLSWVVIGAAGWGAWKLAERYMY